MLCNNCGREVPDNTRFCEHCGAALTPESDPATENSFEQESHAAPQPAELSPVTPATPVFPIDPVDPGASTGKTAFILGLIGLISGAICSCGCSLLGGVVPLILSILAIVFGSQAKKKSADAGFENKKAQTGMILGIVGIVVIVIFIILNAILGAALGASGVYDYMY